MANVVDRLKSEQLISSISYNISEYREDDFNREDYVGYNGYNKYIYNSPCSDNSLSPDRTCGRDTLSSVFSRHVLSYVDAKQKKVEVSYKIGSNIRTLREIETLIRGTYAGLSYSGLKDVVLEGKEMNCKSGAWKVRSEYDPRNYIDIDYGLIYIKGTKLKTGVVFLEVKVYRKSFGLHRNAN